MVKKDCEFCKNEIDTLKERYVLLGTYEKPIELKQESFFHMKCFIEWYNSKVKEKATNVIKTAGGQMMGMLKGINN